MITARDKGGQGETRFTPHQRGANAGTAGLLPLLLVPWLLGVRTIV